MSDPQAPLRCFDDQCRQRDGCRWWQERESGPGKVAMTWRQGWEDWLYWCHRYAPATEAQEENCVSPSVTYL